MISIYVGHVVHIYGVLGSEVGKPSKISIKIVNVVVYIESDIQNIKAPRIDDSII